MGSRLQPYFYATIKGNKVPFRNGWYGCVRFHIATMDNKICYTMGLDHKTVK